ncbi:MAG: mechanosensitive ion channel [Gammaproteobacteria bacterium]|uniref:mechanosensitive ion channel family protein n=1 Tax=Rhodoferax sp. TaxID=50421 RepID=UPI0017B1D5FF|nr:mechanosensitive ion channel domain-containing protein [Rhodoferax sp.]MBU3899705.1 mechanosensitive ion channel [Gammaproteobacteria bacterium]MBA3058347.1 mechanosensitive ion channel [Rhodoferax sp.]MBU3996272.1 mechanosensitive ion channel [Gammaproteobacteria bacterium]MBU4018181.1 mechanosensitive ion channel [Gammaproteobacteria bacterium]MBU4080128.1 mechanosensitive ion channel [Gammaproteobacteria bacterium]
MSDPGIADLNAWFAALTQTGALLELGALAASAVLAWSLTWLARRALGTNHVNSILFGRRLVDGVLFPLLLLCLAYAAHALMVGRVPMAVFRIALPVLISLVVIRLGVKVLQAAFSDTPLVRLLERSISWVAWLAMVMWVSGLLPLVLEQLDQITWKMGESRMSVRTLIEGGLTAGAVLILALWISAAIETRLLRSAKGGELSLRMAASNATRALLMFVGLLVALSAVGIDLTALSVLGGAIGVGVGFGLQKLAANYVSGFVILAERSMRIGDNVRVDNFEGVVMQINARYTVIRSLVGRESIVPNELLITTRVENLSLADSRVWLNTVVSVGYDSDVEQVMHLLKQAALNQARVLREPVPSVNLAAFGADGLEFKLGFWIADPENGSDNLKSLVNLDILKALRENKIEIPYPQRVVHLPVVAANPGL